jgi:hypothetical protein
MKLRALAFVALPLLVAVGAPRASPAPAPHVRLDAGLVRTGGGNWTTLSNVARYGFIVVGAQNANAAGVEPGRAVMYACGTSTFTDDATSSACGVPYSKAVASDWILRDAAGNPIHYKGAGPVLLDVGNAGYQRAFISAIDADLRKHRGIDGVFIDDVTGSLVTDTPASSRYPDSASYRAAMLSFLRVVGPALRRKGWYFDVNASIFDPGAESTTGTSWDGNQFLWWVRQIAPYVDGINLEHWQQNWDSTDSIRLSGSASGLQGWDPWERVAVVIESLHKDFYAMDQGALADVPKATYLRASFLLVWRPGHGAFLYTDDYAGAGDPWGDTATPDVGQPVGARSRVGVGFERTFTRGIVLVNPSGTTAQTFSFRRPYLTVDGAATSSVSLAPGTAQILRATP